MGNPEGRSEGRSEGRQAPVWDLIREEMRRKILVGY